MQSNRGSEYFKNLIKDKTRLKRWRKMILCLSCVVVFCTVYALILPALTLERKTICGQEEHLHTEACYSTEGQLICGKEEHTHTETCYADTQNSQTEDNTEQNQDSEQNKAPDVNEADSVQDVGNEAEAENVAETPTVQANEAIMMAAEPAAEGEGGTGSATTATEGFDLSASANKTNLKGVVLQYCEATQDNWINIQENTDNTIPGDAKIKLTVQYQNVSINELLTTYDCKMTYDIPNLLRNMTAEGKIFDSNKREVGTVTPQGGKIVVAFTRDYLEKLKADGDTVIEGEFYAEGDVKLSQLPEDGKTTLTTADKNYSLDFGPDATAKYGKITVDKQCVSKNKNVISRDDGNYLEYTITVTAGEDGCPDVSVVDTFTNNSSNVDSYAQITTTKTPLKGSENGVAPYETVADGKTHGTIYKGNKTDGKTIPAVPTETTITEPGNMVWKIGDMAAGEVRTLTYFVKLKGKVNLNQAEINNKADVFLKNYQRAYGTDSFTPKIKYDMAKNRDGNNIVKNPDGSYTINYKIEFSLDKNNSNFPLKNFELRDFLDYTDNYVTNPELLAKGYVYYNRNSVKLYVKKDTDIDYSNVNVGDYVTLWSDKNDNYTSEWQNTTNPTRFKIIGTSDKPITVNPGDGYYATYSITVKPEAMAYMKANSIDVKNRFLVAADNVQNKFDYGIDRVYNVATVGGYTWNQKMVGNGTTDAQTITMTGLKYDLTSGKIIEDTSKDTTFTVPAGSYPYTVNVNETQGDWNATSVSMKDTLTPNDKMEYTGYVKVEARKYNPASSNTDKYDVIETKWVKIDKLTEFTLKPSELGWTDKNYAYKFTYYATPKNTGTFSSAVVNNKFTLSGVVKGESSIDISGIYSQTDITISGQFKMNLRKEAWYYEEPKADASTWQNGKIYWVIEVNGTAILKNTSFRDAISNGTELQNSYLHSDSLVGIYKGTLPGGNTITGYKNLREMQTSSGLRNIKDKFTGPELTNEKNFSGTDNYSELTVKAKDTISLDGEKLYFIVQSEPQSLPVNYREYSTYRNQIQTSDDGTKWIDQGSADKSLYSGADILKELGQTFTYDGSTVTSNNDGRDLGDSNKIAASELKKTTGPGQYAAWVFKLNYAGELSGSYQVLEQIPDGMELAYIRIKWVGDKQKQQQYIRSKEIIELKGWTKKTTGSLETDNSGTSVETTYYVKENQALIELGDFTAGKERDSYSVDVQVVCRVTDPQVLLGGENKTFTNRVTLQTTNGEEISTATSPATITPQKIGKTFVSDQQKITFTIEANQLGEALSTVEGTKLKLIDKLSSTLELDITTIKVVNNKNNNVDVAFTASIRDDNTLEIEIPHNVPVKITYTATINAPPGKKVDFSNKVYWEKYSPSSGTNVKQENYSYTAGGTVSSGSTIKLQIIKKDQNNLSASLAGAEFKVVNCIRDSTTGAISEVTEPERKEWDGTTDENGTLIFGIGKSVNYVMEYNTIYKVTETKAPDGYVLDQKPIYIMVPKINDGESDYSEEVKACIKDPQIKKQYKSIYALQVTNHKGEITVEKKFKNPGGYDSNPVSGTYQFGLYENADGKGKPLQTIFITYDAGETTMKSNKFVNLELTKTYYVFELDDSDNPIKDSTKVATVNGMEYFTSYETKNSGGTTSQSNSASNGGTVTITNQSRVKELPSTGSCGVLIYRLAGAILILFAGMLMLINIKNKGSKKSMK